jgi:hypothetical protein
MPKPASSNAREIHFPRLNQGESSTFSILVDKGETAQLKIEVRGKGVTGHAGRKGRPTPVISDIMQLISTLFMGMAVIIFLTQKKFLRERKLLRHH